MEEFVSTMTKNKDEIKKRIDVELGDSGRMILLAISHGAVKMKEIKAMTGLSEKLITRRLEVLKMIKLISDENILTKKGEEYVKIIKSQLEGSKDKY